MKQAKRIKASLTVEASLVLPIFIFFYMIFIYFIQIFITQEVLQEALTEAGLSISRAAYIYSDFNDVTDIDGFDDSILEGGIREGLEELTKATVNHLAIKYTVAYKLNIDMVNNSCIAGGFDGIRFDGSKIMEGNDDIDLVARYRVRIPIRFFGLHEMDMIQRVKLRGWTGYQLLALYTMGEEGTDNKVVYITETGTVYHLKKDCSHIKLSIESIDEKPTWQRNKNGGKYYPCESCCKAEDSNPKLYYISSYGDRYHISRDCSRIKRTVKELTLSRVGSRQPCKRCGK